ncbi:hypothetical protein [Streptosporangium sandarakinum]|uniref:hypothetical protein n=1 Tax=Streptosporangium sandarakinum TaxID=1260955 RepID=UPI0037B8D3F2
MSASLPASFDPWRVLNSIDLPRRPTAETLVARVAAHLGRTIELSVVPGLTALGMCGMWMAGDGVDLVFIDEAAASSPAHKLHITGHELGHILAGHKPTATMHSLLVEVLAAKFPRLPREWIVRSVMARNAGYSCPQERQAEEFATVLMAHVAHQEYQPASTAGRAAMAAFAHPAWMALHV